MFSAVAEVSVTSPAGDSYLVSCRWLVRLFKRREGEIPSEMGNEENSSCSEDLILTLGIGDRAAAR